MEQLCSISSSKRPRIWMPGSFFQRRAGVCRVEGTGRAGPPGCVGGSFMGVFAGQPALLQPSARSPNLPVLKMLPIKWDDKCVLHNCTHGPGGAACYCHGAPRLQPSQVPEQGKLLESYTLIKMLSPHSAEQRLKFVASPIMLSISSRKQERNVVKAGAACK